MGKCRLIVFLASCVLSWRLGAEAHKQEWLSAQREGCVDELAKMPRAEWPAVAASFCTTGNTTACVEDAQMAARSESDAKSLCEKLQPADQSATAVGVKPYLDPVLILILAVVGVMTAVFLIFLCKEKEEKGEQPVIRPQMGSRPHTTSALQRGGHAGTVLQGRGRVPIGFKSGPGTLILTLRGGIGISSARPTEVLVFLGVAGGSDFKCTRSVPGPDPQWDDQKFVPVLDVNETPICTIQVVDSESLQVLGSHTISLLDLPNDVPVERCVEMEDPAGPTFGGSSAISISYSATFETVRGGMGSPVKTWLARTKKKQIPTASAASEADTARTAVTEQASPSASPLGGISVRTQPGGAWPEQARGARSAIAAVHFPGQASALGPPSEPVTSTSDQDPAAWATAFAAPTRPGAAGPPAALGSRSPRPVPGGRPSSAVLTGAAPAGARPAGTSAQNGVSAVVPGGRPSSAVVTGAAPAVLAGTRPATSVGARPASGMLVD
mmetsp:Transcript_12770/g.28651  ORF Transcript_12770/g.28651 Transcript_12770/m.28651 type:complete len:497 (+) Transcript_12770:204-1694(+)|eukprot:CAMPEP_0204337020 /NCGR_PEP_ID=MMETSP0469-20131031/19983_1 /ASSEMBLY_ACC=CAM_ASM_000384 /TAXON_ID=2969 /ORGANISM="Oxyrrhis marina" /LENGTH=496 /DNA_ID=CAMNT_0051320983 /DNA_START=199 /DNA_END=1689 /DNA_ORIENTATION=-